MPINIKITMRETESKQPLVTFIITYHDEPIQWLQDCLRSIMSLTLTEEEREIILVDDGSENSPLIRLIELRDSIIYLRQRNQGLSVARNTGLGIANGKYIQFVDADDYLISAGYEHCLDVVRFKAPDMVMFNFTQEEDEVDSPYLFDGPVGGAEYMRHNNIKAAVWGYIFKQNILIDLRFTAGLLHEDEEFTPRLILRAETVYSTDTCAYFYRKRTDSITSNDSKHWIIRRLNDSEYVILQLHNLAQTLPSQERAALQRRVAQLTMDYLYKIITETHSEHQMETRIARLEKWGLFPLPDKSYTKKYRLFGKIIKNKIGRKVLLYTLGRI